MTGPGICILWIPAHLRCTQCSILLHLIDICFLSCICLQQILQIQTCLCVVVGPGFIVVVVFLPRPMEGMGRLQFSDLFTELPVSPQAAGVVGTNRDLCVCVVVGPGFVSTSPAFMRSSASHPTGSHGRLSPPPQMANRASIAGVSTQLAQQSAITVVTAPPLVGCVGMLSVEVS